MGSRFLMSNSLPCQTIAPNQGGRPASRKKLIEVQPVDATGTKEYRVEFDGKRVRWPWGADGHDVEQAVNNARSLAQWLAGSVWGSVYVTPILALPGGWSTGQHRPPGFTSST